MRDGSIANAAAYPVLYSIFCFNSGVSHLEVIMVEAADRLKQSLLQCSSDWFYLFQCTRYT